MNLYSDKNSTNKNKSVASNSSEGARSQPAVKAVSVAPGMLPAQLNSNIDPVQMVTVNEHFEAGKKMVVAGENHFEIDEEAERAYWSSDERDKALVYESDLMDFDVGGEEDVQLPLDNLYARILTMLSQVTNTLRAIVESENKKAEAAAFVEDGNPRHAGTINFIMTILKDVDKMGEVKQRGFDAPYTLRQQASALLIRNLLTDIFDAVQEIHTGNTGPVTILITSLNQEEGIGRGYLGVAPMQPLRFVRSRTMFDTLNGYAQKASEDTVYKIGQNHLTDISAVAVEGPGWVAVTREQYLHDTGLPVEADEEE